MIRVAIALLLIGVIMSVWINEFGTPKRHDIPVTAGLGVGLIMLAIVFAYIAEMDIKGVLFLYEWNYIGLLPVSLGYASLIMCLLVLVGFRRNPKNHK